MAWLICEGLIEHGKKKDKEEDISYHEFIAMAIYNDLLDASEKDFHVVLMR